MDCCKRSLSEFESQSGALKSLLRYFLKRELLERTIMTTAKSLRYFPAAVIRKTMVGLRPTTTPAKIDIGQGTNVNAPMASPP